MPKYEVTAYHAYTSVDRLYITVKANDEADAIAQVQAGNHLHVTYGKTYDDSDGNWVDVDEWEVEPLTPDDEGVPT